MAKSQYSADSAHSPDTFPRPLMPPGGASLPVTDDGDPGVWHPFATLGIDVPAETAHASITLHN